ncbi:phosphoesterase [Alteromonas gilva]|uniref:Phosphoesterase n=1 Tax=Alteromonas gilva TaxID=2987522 RepID=A0ABT5L676_9ALTE|nr:phosphoesterase [Alteromonas gilva]MDC8831909.1 phosphoesterase [Alteromonas gilva]
MLHRIIVGLLATALLNVSGCQSGSHTHSLSYSHNHTQADAELEPQWLAGDHHIHSHYSVGWDRSVSPPKPILAGDALYSTPKNARMASIHGLDWMVTTDHGGPNHSKVNLDMAYPELKASREAVPQVLQFYGMELDTPGARHSSLIIPHSDEEAHQLFHIEKHYNRREVLDESTRDDESFMLEALSDMHSHTHRPVVLANHPGRTATGLGEYTKVTPRELRDWHDTAPDVAIGMEGAPGHQANAINPDGSIDPAGIRGGYDNYPTMGGFDQMTAHLGGFWDSMLGEGRRWFITATSDSHAHYTDGRTDFWPGEYSKTYVYANKTYESVLENLRNGRVFVTTGDLIDALFVTVTNTHTGHTANIADNLSAEPGDELLLTVKFRDPDRLNFNNENPQVNRLDIIVGDINGPVADRTADRNLTTRVLHRFYASDWKRDEDGFVTLTMPLSQLSSSSYVRIRGTTNTNELEPQIDPPGENPWHDLWFYSNPVFIHF